MGDLPKKQVIDSGGIILDTTQWPVVLQRFPKHGIALDDLKEHLSHFTAIHDAAVPFATIHDVSLVQQMVDARVRRTITDWIHTIAPNAAVNNVASAIYLRSQIVRAAVTALHWVAKPKNPVMYVRSLKEGAAFCCEHLDKRGIPRPPRVHFWE